MSEHRIRVWDLPTRLFHWLLLLVFIGLFATAWQGEFDWHMRLGWAMLALLMFRLLWGLVGGRWSRFANFPCTPAQVRAYLRGEPVPTRDGPNPGHNPLGSISVFAILLLLAMQVTSGLMSDDEIAYSGPLARFVSGETVGAMTSWHIDWGQWVLLVLAALHIAAILFYRFVKKENLVGPMLHGDKTLPAAAEPAQDSARQRLLALVLFLTCAGVASWVFSL